jgi:hypothetical protein
MLILKRIAQQSLHSMIPLVPIVHLPITPNPRDVPSSETSSMPEEQDFEAREVVSKFSTVNNYRVIVKPSAQSCR